MPHTIPRETIPTNTEHLSFQEREHAISQTQIALFLDGVSRTKERQELFPPTIPPIIREAVQESAERHGYRADVSNPYAVITIFEKISKENEKKALASMRKGSLYLPWHGSVYNNPAWQSQRSNDPNVSFEWNIGKIASITTLPYKQHLQLDQLLEKDLRKRDALIEQIKQTPLDEKDILKKALQNIRAKIQDISFLFMDDFKKFFVQEIIGIMVWEN